MVRTNESQNSLVRKYSQNSPVLNPDMRNIYADIVDLNSLESVHSYRRKLVGGVAESGKYLDRDNRWVTARVPAQENCLKAIKSKFREFQNTQMRIGKAKPTEYPPELKEAKMEAEAHIMVCQEELAILEKRIEELTVEETERLGAILPRKRWKVCVLKDGKLHTIGGMLCQVDEDGLMRIQDSRSPYSGLLVHRFSSCVLAGMEREHSLRQRRANAQARQENRGPETVSYPAAPIWDKVKDTFEYPGYDPRTIKKIIELTQK